MSLSRRRFLKFLGLAPAAAVAAAAVRREPGLGEIDPELQQAMADHLYMLNKPLVVVKDVEPSAANCTLGEIRVTYPAGPSPFASIAGAMEPTHRKLNEWYRDQLFAHSRITRFTKGRRFGG